jgi:hypothetical protein
LAASAGFWDSRLDTGRPGALFCCHIPGQILSCALFSRQLFVHSPPASDGPAHARLQGMTKIAYNVSRKSRIFNTALVPANHSEEARFGPIDGAVIVFFLICVAGFICFLVA